MRVRFALDFDDVCRAAIRWHQSGRAGLATRKECVAAVTALADADLAVIVEEFRGEFPQRTAELEAAQK